MKNVLRAFIAIDINDTIKQAILSVQNNLRQSGADVKWVETKNIHLTLKFLGDITRDDIPAVEAVMAKATNRPAFPISITDIGAFPDILFPQIIWAGVTENAGALTSIVENLNDGLKRLKIKKEDRPFSPHITIGRVKSNRNNNQLVAALEENWLPKTASQTVDSLRLYESRLTSEGPIYSVLAEKFLTRN